MGLWIQNLFQVLLFPRTTRRRRVSSLPLLLRAIRFCPTTESRGSFFTIWELVLYENVSFLVSTDSRWALLPLPCQQTTAYHGNKVDIDGTENKRTDRRYDIKRSLAFFSNSCLCSVQIKQKKNLVHLIYAAIFVQTSRKNIRLKSIITVVKDIFILIWNLSILFMNDIVYACFFR